MEEAKEELKKILSGSGKSEEIVAAVIQTEELHGCFRAGVPAWVWKCGVKNWERVVTGKTEGLKARAHEVTG